MDPSIADMPTVPPPAANGKVARPIEFVEVRDRSAAETAVGGGEPAVVPPVTLQPATEPGWSLWGDPDR